MKHLIVVNNPQQYQIDIEDVEVVSAKQYLTDATLASLRNVKIINACRSYRYQSIGYYVSLLAEARGHKPFPTVQTIQDLKSTTMARIVSSDLDEVIQTSMKHLTSDKFTLSIHFGHNVSKCHDKLAASLFQHFPAPFLQAQFSKINGHWLLQNISPVSFGDIPADQQEFALQSFRGFVKKGFASKKRIQTRFDLAILYNPSEPDVPSNEKAMQKFLKAAIQVGFDPEIITRDDYSRIGEFDALFIRETTAVNHHTYRFARRAQAEGLVVIDDPQSILKCTNKVYLAELMDRHKVPIPKTVILHADNINAIGEQLGFPCVIKQPDSSFSNGVTKVESEQELCETTAKLLDKSELLIAQEFIPTSFDWRVCVFQGQPIFVIKYYMARKHWQIYERLNGKTFCGKTESFPVYKAPKKVVKTAVRAANLIGSGLYGVDIKELDGRCYVIEVNDNPSIDAGIEDTILQDELYLKIMSGLLDSVEKQKNGYLPV